MAKDLKEKVLGQAGIEQYEVLATLPGSEFELMTRPASVPGPRERHHHGRACHPGRRYRLCPHGARFRRRRLSGLQAVGRNG